MKYTQRLDHFHKPWTWEISPEALSWTTEDGGEGRIPLTAIRSIRLRYQPTRAETNRFAMLVTAGKQMREFTISNINYKGPMNFENQSADFKAFVYAVHEAIAAADTKTEFKAGSTPAVYAMNVLLNLFVIGLLGVILFILLTSGVWWLVAVKAMIILFFVPTMLIQLKKNWPTTYSPTDIPQHLLPA